MTRSNAVPEISGAFLAAFSVRSSEKRFRTPRRARRRYDRRNKSKESAHL